MISVSDTVLRRVPRPASTAVVLGSTLLTLGAWQSSALAADAPDGIREAAAASAASADSIREAAAPAPTEEVTDLSTVIVRTRNKLEPLQDVPISVSVVTGPELERLDALDINALVKRVGNISWNLGNQRTSSLSIRGIGKQGQTEAQDPSVGTVVDGINYAYNALVSSYDFTDVDTVELARGPQGTLQGKNATLGILNIATRRPSFTPDAEYSVTVGDRGTVIGHAAGGGPVFDGLLAWRGTLSAERGQGDVKNLYNVDSTYQNKDRVTGRIQLLYTPTPDVSARFSYNLTPYGGETTNSRTINLPTPTVYSNGSTNTLATDASTRLSRPWFTQQTSYTYQGTYLYGAGQNAVDNDYANPLTTGSSGGSAQLDWTLGKLSLTSITGYETYHFNAINDDGTPFDIYYNGGGFLNNYRQLSEELRLSNQEGGFVDYQTGLYFFKMNNAAEYRRSWGADAGAWFASTAQYNRLDLAVNPDGSVSGGRYLLRDSLNSLAMDFNSPTGLQFIRNKSYAAFAQADWHFTKKFTVTTGARASREDRVTTGDSLVRDNGDGDELNPVSVNSGPQLVQMGGFASGSTGALTAGDNSAVQLSLADQVANKYFGVKITTVPGAAYNSLTAPQKQQVADAKAIRLAQIGVVFPQTDAQPFKKTQPAFVLSPSYKFSDTETGYISYQYGEKAGISQFVNGVSYRVDAEKNTAYEIGLKSSLLDHTLTINADLYWTKIKNYQQSIRVLDTYTTNLNLASGIPASAATAYTSATGNVPKVESRGFELDAYYSGIKYTTIRLAAAYTDAFYKSFPNSAQPVENGYTGAPAYQDVTGQTLPGASKYTANLGVDLRIPILDGKAIRVSFNSAYQSRFNSDNSLSAYGWVPGSGITDIGVGFSAMNNSFDVGVIAKNAFNDGTHLSNTWNSYTPPYSRWLGVIVSGRL